MAFVMRDGWKREPLSATGADYVPGDSPRCLTRCPDDRQRAYAACPDRGVLLTTGTRSREFKPNLEFARALELD